MPADLRPAGPEAPSAEPGRVVSWFDLLTRWDLVTYDLSRLHGIDLHDPAVLARPWPGVRGMILGLLEDDDSRLAADLKE